MRIVDLKKMDEYQYKEITKLFENDKVLQDHINWSYIQQILLIIGLGILLVVEIKLSLTSDNGDFHFSTYLFIFFLLFAFLQNSIKVNQLIKFIKRSNLYSRQE